MNLYMAHIPGSRCLYEISNIDNKTILNLTLICSSFGHSLIYVRLSPHLVKNEMIILSFTFYNFREIHSILNNSLWNSIDPWNSASPLTCRAINVILSPPKFFVTDLAQISLKRLIRLNNRFCIGIPRWVSSSHFCKKNNFRSKPLKGSIRFW